MAFGKQEQSISARVLGSGTAGILELVLFHPVDTVAKRLMNNKTPISASHTLSSVIFKDAATKSLTQKWKSLFPGIGFAAGYKILQRIYKFGGQPVLNDWIKKTCGKDFDGAFGPKYAKMMIHATAGSLIGIGEIALLPLDVLKIKMQTNPQALSGRGLSQIIRDEGMGLYRGASWTAARNAPGSFALFGGSAVTKELGFGLKDYSSATFFQNFCASIAGAVASITISAPFDVVKTRIQAAKFSDSQSGLSIVKEMVRREGVGSFFKGLTPKLLVVGPKLIFSFTIAQQLIPVLAKYI